MSKPNQWMVDDVKARKALSPLLVAPADGTPSTLHQAVLNGLAPFGIAYPEIPADTIRVHVRDFLAQKFNAAYLGEIKTFEELWDVVTHE